jgi:tRNA pseudouridine synthase 10
VGLIYPEYLNNVEFHSDLNMKKQMADQGQMETMQQILSEYSICDFCIGRLHAQNCSIEEYKKLGEHNRETSTDRKKNSNISCELCDGILHEIDHLKELIYAAVEEYEFFSFVLGFHVDNELVEKENRIINLLNTFHSEPLKVFLKKAIGKHMENKLGKPVFFDHPDIMIVVNTMFRTID